MRLFTLLASLAFCGFVAVATWVVGMKLSSDAISFGIGVLFGVGAGIPTALLVLAGQRHNGVQFGREFRPPTRYPQDVIVMAGPAQTPPEYSPYGGRQGYAPALPDEYPAPREITVRPTVPVERDWGEINGW